MEKFYGTGVALVTPFNRDGSVDFDGLERLVEHNIANGINYLVISGTTGESATIIREEKTEITSFIAKVNAGRLPLVLGVGGNNTQAVISEIKSLDLSQIDAILSVSPYYSKPTQAGIYSHFKAIAESTDKDIILYNVPGRTSSNILPETIVKLAHDFSNVVAVKEAAGNISQYYELISSKPDGFLVISGDDDLALAVTLAGGAGVISVIAQALTKDFTDMINFGLANDAESGYKLQYKLQKMLGLIFSENNPAGIKSVLEHLGICKPWVRLPLVEATKSLSVEIREELNSFK